MTVGDVHVTLHAETRWRERVDRRCALDAVRAFVATGKASKRPPRWLPINPEYEGMGVLYAVNADVPGVCAVIDNNVVITVITRQDAKQTWRNYAEVAMTARRKRMTAA